MHDTYDFSAYKELRQFRCKVNITTKDFYLPKFQDLVRFFKILEVLNISKLQFLYIHIYILMWIPYAFETNKVKMSYYKIRPTVKTLTTYPFVPISNSQHTPIQWATICRADSRFAPSQCETSLQSNAVSHWLSTNLEWALILDQCAPAFG